MHGAPDTTVTRVTRRSVLYVLTCKSGKRPCAAHIQMTSIPPARLTIRRQSADDIQQREVFVSLDGTELAILRYGESVTREVEPGDHELRAHNTLFRQRRQLTLSPGEHVQFNVVNRPGWGTYALMSVLGAGPLYLSLDLDTTGNTAADAS